MDIRWMCSRHEDFGWVNGIRASVRIIMRACLECCCAGMLV